VEKVFINTVFIEGYNVRLNSKLWL